MIQLSLVIPVLNEKESLLKLLEEINTVCEANEISYEVLFIDDGSTDGSFALIEKESAKDSRIKGIRFRKNCGKATALNQGFLMAQGESIITMDGDLQDNPSEIPEILHLLKQYDVVSGWKKKRYDPIHKTVPSKLFNKVTRMISGLELHDFNCGLKGYRKEVAKSLKLYGELHRYIPVLAHWNGFTVVEKVVEHRAREFGQSKYGLSRLSNGLFDLVTLLFLHRYTSRPLHVFGFTGLCFNALGIVILGYFFLSWVVTGTSHLRPLMIGGISSILLGVQIISLGLLAEMIVQRSEINPPIASETDNIKEEAL